jgi:peptidoglycan/LPS O-acetylase OafA/YrhL
MTEINTGSKIYLPYLDGLRALAALLVVLHHTMLQFKFNFNELSKLQKYSITPFFYGHYAVCLFIVLSGFSLSITIVNSDNYKLPGGIKAFLKKRIRRILTPYYFALVFSTVLAITLISSKTGRGWDNVIPVNMADIVTHCLLIQDLFASTVFKINHALWSISVEFRIYLFFPFLLWVWNRFGMGAIIATTLTISLIFFFITVYINSNYGLGLNGTFDGVNPFIILFAFGMMAAQVSLSKNVRLTSVAIKTPWLILSLIVFIGNLFIKGITDKIAWPYWFEVTDVLFGLSAALFLIAVVRSKSGLLRKIFSFRPLVFIGSISYSLYLVHAPLIQLIWLYIANKLNTDELHKYYFIATIGLALIVLISYLFYLGFERPFLTHKHNLNKKRLYHK